MGPASIVIQRRIEWSDTDASGHYHYHTALRLLDAAEAALHDRLGIAGETFGRTPRANVRMRYRRVLRFNDLVDVHLRVASVGRSSIVYAGEILLDGASAAEGELVAAHVSEAGGTVTALPDRWRELLTGAGPQTPERMT
jgi:acyl-CoA thioesterase FadM